MMYDPPPLREAMRLPAEYRSDEPKNRLLEAYMNVMSKNKWKPYNTALEAGFLATNLLDAISTRNGLRGDAEEVNPVMRTILGEKPSDLGIGLMMLGTSIAHPLIATNIDEPYRTSFQGLTLLAKLLALRSNLKLGAKISL